MRRQSSGFTLVELIITIVVMAILAGIAAPSFLQSIDNRRLSGAAEAVKNGMHVGRSQAFQRSVETCLRIDGEADSQWVVVEACDSNACVDGTDKCLMQVRSSRFPGVTTATNFGEAVFDPVRGTVQNFLDGNAALGTVQLTSSRGSRLDVELNLMGRARICAPSGEQGAGSLGYGAC
ncbi:GspH/FimT family pseudopilin [Thioalkalivibrio sp.]|uniref:pilus assembly FimT family protein n=1 Tax=Thioalkalivibrio sp. TaxID=2093813 RepID=UPI0012D6112B|nr:GspH/FimT family pseudopilin [Thioalkalivibrio sp.]TVP81509.1 MAG: prepilin-type N-terminal cleavage/methylation domain-containing protein [Thioalkalivibrio sp.]